ncbi:MAG: DUF952 domain-containing protein [Pseudomonadota bacterium]
MRIYKVFRAAEQAQFEASGETEGAPIDLVDGYIHFSTAEQLAETLAKHFSGELDLVLLAVEADGLREDLRWEPSRGGALFPHLYRALHRGDIAAKWDLTVGADGLHQLPEGL